MRDDVQRALRWLGRWGTPVAVGVVGAHLSTLEFILATVGVLALAVLRRKIKGRVYYPGDEDEAPEKR